MNHRGIPEVFWQLWAAFNLMRELGFSSDDIFASMANNGNRSLPFYGQTCGFIHLKTQRKDFTLCCYPTPDDMTREQFDAQWKDFSNKLPSLPESLLKDVWDTSLAKQERVLVMKLLTEKGFVFPRNQN